MSLFVVSVYVKTPLRGDDVTDRCVGADVKETRTVAVPRCLHVSADGSGGSGFSDGQSPGQLTH